MYRGLHILPSQTAPPTTGIIPLSGGSALFQGADKLCLGLESCLRVYSTGVYNVACQLRGLHVTPCDMAANVSPQAESVLSLSPI